MHPPNLNMLSKSWEQEPLFPTAIRACKEYIRRHIQMKIGPMTHESQMHVPDVASMPSLRHAPMSFQTRPPKMQSATACTVPRQ